jgi:hypothetical protein
MVRAVAGGTVTTTGGRGDVDLTTPVVGRADGDDIVVLPDDRPSRSRGRMRAFLVTAIVVGLAGAGITIGLVSRHDTGATTFRSVSSLDRSPNTKIPPSRVRRVATATPAKPRIGAPRASVAPTVGTTVPTTAVAVAPPPVTPTLPTAPPTTPEYPASVLTWQSTPAAVTIKAGSHASFTVTVSNPTDGTVTLGLPLSCPPVLQPEHGAPIGGAVCAQMAQVMSPHQTLTQQYTIYATDTGDATGTALAPGGYIARVENLFSVRVTITAS